MKSIDWEKLMAQHSPAILSALLTKNYSGLMPIAQSVVGNFMADNKIKPLRELTDEQLREKINLLDSKAEAFATFALYYFARGSDEQKGYGTVAD